jgi:hypothetical protein
MTQHPRRQSSSHSPDTSQCCVLLAGCKSACNRHGTCALQDGEYHCVCSDGWAGLDCSIRLEIKCNDEIDNDEGENQHN